MAQAAIVLREKRRRERRNTLQLSISEEDRERNLSITTENLPGCPSPTWDSKYRRISKDQKGRYFQAKAGRKDKSDESFRKRNKIDEVEGEEGVYRASSSANVVLYVGLGMISIGLVITFVGLGDKGFRTLELKLVGPSLVGCGVFFSLLRILFCTVPSCCQSCCSCCRKTEDNQELLDQENDPQDSKTGTGNKDKPNLSAKVGPTVSGHRSSHRQTSRRADAADGAESDEEGSESSGEFKRKTLKNSQNTDREAVGDSSVLAASTRAGAIRGRSKIRSNAKPLAYDNYSTDTSSQFSVDVVEVEPMALIQTVEVSENIEAGQVSEAREVVLNASRLKVETET